MKVKIGDVIYDSNEQPVMVILTPDDKANIAAMLPDKFRYCSFPDTYDPEQVREWMVEGTQPQPRKFGCVL